MRYQILTDELIDEISGLPEGDQANWLILSESHEFSGYWSVDALDPDFLYDFEDIVGSYRIVSPVRIDAFLDRAQESKYKVAFVSDPTGILEAYAQLKQEPPLSLNSDLENTVCGFLPWQIIGFNKLVRDESLPAGLAIWDTGAGKTALIAASIKYHQMRGDFDVALVVAKSHNKLDTKRKLKALADIDSIILDGYNQLKRFEAYAQVEDLLDAGKPVVAITNYEKFREDPGIFDYLLHKRRCLFYWDEMPARLGSRTTQLYRAVKSALYASFFSEPHPSWMRHLMLSATPIERDPDDVYSCVNLMRPRLLGTVTQFHAEHVAHVNAFRKPDRWQNLDKIEAKLDHMTHRVSKDDPEVAAMFPEVVHQRMIIDWNPKHRAVYDKLTGKAKDLLEDEFEDVNILELIQIMQMVCDAPSIINASAANREDFIALLARAEELGDVDVPLHGPRGSSAAQRLLDTLGSRKLSDAGHTKLATLKDIVLDKHPDAKIVMHSTWAEYIFPVWEFWLQKWGISSVTYHGTPKQKQDNLDLFREDPDIRMFLSGDAGADSLDIAEASVQISYNGSWKATTDQVQRPGRINRVNSKHEINYVYELSMADSVEDRKREVRDRKYGYHTAIFEGRAVESALSARLTADDLRYMLFGDAEVS